MKSIKLLSLLFLVVLSATPDLQKTQADEISIDELRSVPVFHQGRIKPFDSYAKEMLEQVCNTTKGYVELDMGLYFPNGYNTEELQGVAHLFPEREMKWSATEIVLSWMTEPEHWENVPFIYAAHNDIRKIIDVPIADLTYKYVSPAELKNSTSLATWLDIPTNAKAKEFKQLEKVLGRLDTYRGVSLQADSPLTGEIQIADIGDRKGFCTVVRRIIDLLSESNENQEVLFDRLSRLSELFRGQPPSESGQSSPGQLLAQSIQQTLAYSELMQVRSLKILGMLPVDREDIAAATAPERMTIQAIAEDARIFCYYTQLLESNFANTGQEFSDSPAGLSAEQLKEFQSLFREMEYKAHELHLLALQLQEALYANRQTMLILPSSNPYTLAKNRTEGQNTQPWISLQAVLHDTLPSADQLNNGLLAKLEETSINRVRSSWKAITTAYRSRDREGFDKAEADFLQALQTLGPKATEARDSAIGQTLSSTNRDTDVMEYTAYPEGKAFSRILAEIKYNDSKPFQYTAIFSFLALIAFSLSFGAEKVKRIALYSGIFTLMIGLLWTVYGFYLRVMITGWAPVTNMYETIIFVPFIVSLLAAWFLLNPVVLSGIKDSWRLTAAPFLKNIPFFNEARDLTEQQTKRFTENTWTIGGYITTVQRVLLTLALFHFLTQVPYGDGGRPYVELWPSDMSSFNRIGVWAVGFICLLLTLWIIPRFILATIVSPSLVIQDYFRRLADKASSKKVFDEMHKRRFFGIGGTFMTGIGGLVLVLSNGLPADAQIVSENFSPLQPVLRSNFWLTIHVLTIVASYGAGGLALGIGNIALYYYSFGKYGTSAEDGKKTQSTIFSFKLIWEKLKSAIYILTWLSGTWMFYVGPIAWVYDILKNRTSSTSNSILVLLLAVVIFTLLSVIIIPVFVIR
ncbi:MAG: hypothetical protein VX776_05795, partial [Planctomycetota bacterium]|nr:hypothetical protein [Planctomycetota bacterium]